MERIACHLFGPAILPALFFGVAFTPVEVLGCFNRGLIAVLISLVSGLLALATSIRGAKRRLRGEPGAFWWLGSTLILVTPVIGLLLMA